MLCIAGRARWTAPHSAVHTNIGWALTAATLTDAVNLCLRQAELQAAPGPNLAAG